MKAGFAAAIILIAYLPLGSAKRLLLSTRLRRLLVMGCAAILLAGLSADVEVASKMRLDRFLDANPADPQGTAYWRAVWWQNLSSAVAEHNPAFGLGFGLNLSVYNPLISAEELRFWPVRSPHNFNMTVFARMGFVGAMLWAAILLLGIGALLLKVCRRPVRGEPIAGRSEEIAFWLLALVCTWLNASFGVLMEGPVLAVVFWLFLGFAAARRVAIAERQPAPQPHVQAPSLAELWALERDRCQRLRHS
jgi:O-antigen ligase